MAKAYRDEMGEARAEQLAARAIARAGVRTPRLAGVGYLVSSAALAAAALAVGVVVLLGGDTEPAASDADPQTPVASAPVTEVTASDEVVALPLLSQEELRQALDLIDQSKALEAAEVVMRVLSPITVPTTQPPGGTSTVTTLDVVGESSPTTTSPSNEGVVPPEQSTHPGEESSPGTDNLEPDPPGREETSDTQPDATVPPPTIEELGQVLRVEVEELLAADPTSLVEAAEEVREAATPILEYGNQEPTIILPSGNGEDGVDGGGQ